MSAKIMLKLNSGHEIPATGFGTWQAPPGQVLIAVYEALKAGYRHLDLAKIYRNQREVGEAIRKGMADFNIKREEIFITSKLWCNSFRPDRVAPALDQTLEELGLDYLDLYLVHWPAPFGQGEELVPVGPDGKVILDKTITLTQTWRAMIALPKSKVRSVGVSNYSIEHLKKIIKDTGVVPAMNQIERHPRVPNFPLIDYCREMGILITAYSAYGNNHFNVPLLVNHEKVIAAAASYSKRHGKEVTAPQILCAWARYDAVSKKSGHSVIPKSVTPSRIVENFVEVELDEEAYNELNVLGETEPRRFNIPMHDTPCVNVNIFNDDVDKHGTPVVLEV
ncbi:Glycerol dehydrogenase (NADP(+)) [Escovopsis weberi]|uniref:Glycerol dehydrogenase (NADP(+)) n=1 Tax=Escovopsis weberi TaxID=150374 RepID=A0A0N0RTT8_ESCWE|nr:Glycerol dehydrogenase (NADP(+)) [Escovopsis weberi]